MSIGKAGCVGFSAVTGVGELNRILQYNKSLLMLKEVSSESTQPVLDEAPNPIRTAACGVSSVRELAYSRSSARLYQRRQV